MRVRKRVRDRTPRTETLHRLHFVEPGNTLDRAREETIARGFIRLAVSVGVGAALFTVLVAIDPDPDRVKEFFKRILDLLGG